MKILFSFCIVFSIVFQLKAQYSTADYGGKLLSTFYTTKTFAVLTGNTEFDVVLKKHLTENWKHTPIDFMTEAEFKRNIHNKTYSFITFLKVLESQSRPQNYSGPVLSNGNTQYGSVYPSGETCYYGIINGGKSLSKYRIKDMVAYCPLDYYGDENLPLRARYRLPIMLHNLNKTLTLVKEKELKGNDRHMINGLVEHYNKSKSLVKTKTLWVVKLSVPNVKEEEFKENYPFPFKYCTKEEAEEAIAKRDKNVLIYNPIYAIKCNTFVFDAETYDCVFADYDNFTYWVNPRDVKRFTKELEKPD